MAGQQNQDVNQLLKVRREKLQELQQNGKDPFRITKYDVTHHSQEIKDQFDALENTEVTIAGRMMFKPGSFRQYPGICGKRRHRGRQLQGF